MRRTIAAAVCLWLISIAWSAAWAGRTRSFLVEGAAAYEKGEMSGVAIDEEGRVAPGPTPHRLTDDAGAQVWCLLRARNGIVYAGSGSDGTVYRVEGARVRRAAETFEYEVFAVVEGRDGRIFASGAPNATITEILPDGTARSFFDTPEKIVWAMVADKEGNLYAATGERGLLYKIGPDGKGRVLYRAEDSHVTSLAWSSSGKLIAGTSGRGLLLEIDPGSGAGEVLYEAAGEEIPTIAAAPSGVIYFAVVGPPKDGTSKKNGDAGDSGDNEAPVEGSQVLLREIDGTVRPHWQSPDQTVHALSLDGAGNLLVGTGSDAALYRVTPTGEQTLLWRPDEGQVLAILPGEPSIIVGTGNPGRIYAVGPEREGAAWVRPEPLDTSATASWGHAIWEILPGSGGWEIVTRTGFTESPDSSWSPWSDPLRDPEGSQITSPAARYIQCEARYTASGEGAPALLRRIWIPYGAPNLPPRLGAIRFAPGEAPAPREGREAGVAYTQDLGGGLRVQFQRGQDAGPSADDGDGPPAWVRDVRSVVWDASDPDGDDLRFEVGLRQVGEDRFRMLARNQSTPAYAIDTSTLPDGQYEVRIKATDAPSNPPGEALTDERVAGPFRVDHRAPTFSGVAARRGEGRTLVIEGKVQDDGSPIVRLEASWDGHPWRPISSTDGFLDAREETFHAEIPLERDEEGWWIAVRATDASGNAAADRVWLKP